MCGEFSMNHASSGRHPIPAPHRDGKLVPFAVTTFEMGREDRLMIRTHHIPRRRSPLHNYCHRNCWNNYRRLS